MSEYVEVLNELFVLCIVRMEKFMITFCIHPNLKKQKLYLKAIIVYITGAQIKPSFAVFELMQTTYIIFSATLVRTYHFENNRKRKIDAFIVYKSI